MNGRLDFCLSILVIIFFIVIGCVESKDPLDKVSDEISSMEQIELKFNEIDQTYYDSRFRVYKRLHDDREIILKIAEGQYNQNDLEHIAVVQKMAWIILCELKTLRPQMQIVHSKEIKLQERNSQFPDVTYPNPSVSSESISPEDYDIIK